MSAASHRIWLGLSVVALTGAALLWLNREPRSKTHAVNPEQVAAQPGRIAPASTASVSTPAIATEPAPTPRRPVSSAHATHADPSLIAKTDTRLKTTLLELSRAHPDRSETLRIPLPLRAGRDFVFTTTAREIHGPDEGTFAGMIEGYPGSFVVLSYVGLAQAGTVQLPAEGRAFRIRGDEDGSVRIEEVDLTKAPECGACIAQLQAANPTH